MQYGISAKISKSKIALKIKAKKIKLFFKKGLTNGKSFGIIDKPTSGGNSGRGACSLKIEQQRKFFSTCKCERISLMFS